MYKSQGGQDKWIEKMTGASTGCFFVDVGAYDGIESSNTYYLEQVLGWRGICIEAGPSYFKTLEKNRPLSININKAVMPYRGTCLFSNFEVTTTGEEVECDTLSNILTDSNAPQIIDYLSLDIEGGEVGALESFDWSLYRINLITVEHNLYLNGPKQKDEIYRLLIAQGYVRVVENAVVLEQNPAYYLQPFEDWYAHSIFLSDQK